ncbi:MAG: mechanosensitive ion channel family protein [Candidatus Woesearchaeota archaeon]
MVDVSELINQSMLNAIDYAPKVLGAILVLVLGLWVIAIIRKFLNKAMLKRKLEASLRHFLSSFLSISLKILLVITVISMLGVATTSFIAVLAAAGFAVGLALQGSLSNFAGGVLILVTKPFRVGDFIEAQGFMGSVSRIEILVTTLKTPDNKTIIIPNGALSNGSVVNFSTEKTRRVDMIFGISYSDNIDVAKALLEKLIKKDKRVLKDPAHQVVVSKLNDSSVDLSVRVWVNASDYWGLFFDMQKLVKEEFDKNGISIPFPQRDVYIHK